MAVMKRLAIILALIAAPLLFGLLFTYDIIKIEWVSFMEIQPSFSPQEDPLPMPARSVPIDGAVLVANAAQLDNPVPANENSLARGEYFYNINCAQCHGPAGQGNGPFAVYLRERPPSDLTAESAVSRSDGEIYEIISNGIEGAMPSLRQNLPDPEMRWSVTNYVRQLQGQ